MPEQFLNFPNVVAVFRQVRGGCVLEQMVAHRLDQPHPCRGLFDSSLQNRFVQVMLPSLFEWSEAGPFPTLPSDISIQDVPQWRNTAS
jgi:hypothetical protein